MNRRRLEVEAWRDAMLAVAGGSIDPSAALRSASTRRQSPPHLYAAVSRHDLPPLLRLFDFPDPNITSGGRVETTVPLQQLFVLNSEFMVRTPGRSSAGCGPRPGDDDADADPPGLPLALRPVPRADREIELGLSLPEVRPKLLGRLTADTGREPARPI